MDESKLQAIKELMEELIGEMEPSGEDFDMRLGKPKVEALEVEAKVPMDGDDIAMEGEFSPEDELRERIMGLKG